MTEPTSEELDFLRSCGVPDVADFTDRCMKYQELLYKTNETFNLTRIPESEFFTKHVCDSISIARFVDVFSDPRHVKICDVGCGAGIPSLFLAAAFPQVYMTAVDSRGKKVKFVEEAASAMSLTNIRGVHARAGELGADEKFYHVFPLVTARAVSDAAGLIMETERLISKHGVLVIYRTPVQMAEERPMLERIKASFSVSEELDLPGGAGARLFLTIKRS